MLKLTHPDLSKQSLKASTKGKLSASAYKIKSVLLRQKKEVQEDLKRLEKEDPVFEQSLPEAMESGEASWMADVHTRVVALKDSLLQSLKRTEKSLEDLEKGKYGKCERCGKEIESQRLKAIPTATLCISCSKKAVK